MLVEAELCRFLRLREHTDQVDALIDLSESTLVHFLGQDWVQDHVRNGASANYFRIRDEREGDAFRHHHRYISLAEMLFNLQGYEGFGGIVERLLRGEIEGSVAELEVGQYLAACELQFSFRTPTGRRGLDYDADAFLSDGMPIAVEGKCKVEGTSYSYETILNSLSSARKQLPRDRPGVVFMKLAEEWFLGDHTGRELETALLRFFANTNRVDVVVLRWERWVLGDEGARMSARYDVRGNPRTPNSPVSPLVLNPKKSGGRWLSYPALVGLP